MAVNNNNGGQTTLGDSLRTAGITQDSVAAGAPRQGQSARQRFSSGGMNLNAILTRPIPRYGASEVAGNFMKAMEEDFQEKVSNNEQYRDFYQFQLLDHNRLGIPLSLITMIMTEEFEGKNHAGVFTFVVAASGNKLPNRFINYGNGQQVEVDVVPGDMINDDMWAVVTRYLSEQYGQDVVFHNAGAAVLPREMNPESKSEIAAAVYNASQALFTVLDNQVSADQAAFSIDMLKEYQLQGTIEYNPAPIFGLGHLPIRNDVSVALNYLTRVTGLVGNQSETVNGLTRVAGYIDLEYVGPAAPPQGAMGYNPYVQVPTQQYVPRFVITDLDSRIDAITPETTLLGLITAGMTGQHLAWVRSFEPRLGLKKNEEDLRDIGALGYVINYGGPEDKPGRIDTRGTFSQQELFNLVTFSVYNQLIVSQDVEETGTLAWLNQMFIAAANGSQDAYNLVINAADQLTNGVFKTLWQGGAITRDDANRVHLGFYIDKNGDRRDLREIDRLAILNLFGGRDADVINNWDRSWLDISIPMEIRLEMRAKILKNLLNGVEITGYARRISYTEVFIKTLTEAAYTAGLRIQQTNMTMILQSGIQRPVYDPNGVALMDSNLGSNVYSMQSAGGYQGFRGAASAFTGRFG